MIGIIGAMELEVEELKSLLQDVKVTSRAGMDFYQGSLSGAQVVIVRCGIGKVNAALCVQILADVFHVTHVINTGVAGSLNAVLDIGDILISVDAVHHDMDVSPLGYAPGIVPQMAESFFKADERLVNLAWDVCQEVNPDVSVLKGRVVSGDQFIAKKEVKERLINTFHGDCAEMEGAAIAHGCYLNQIPFVIIRAISDKADDSAEMDYPTFEKAAAKHCAKLVENLVPSI
ncbi:MAG: 5'-methylthioadenosine/adenosylhomocysteine nucleosidase [Lachnospiraceae bacterium]|nr:5'-methylthioadenosine/adenosylhomocysteine nucleosidase [Lachnospiraceae bacterium]